MEETIGAGFFAVYMIYPLKEEGNGVPSIFDQTTGLQLIDKAWTVEYLLNRDVDTHKCNFDTPCFYLIEQYPKFINTRNIDKPHRLKIDQ